MREAHCDIEVDEDENEIVCDICKQVVSVSNIEIYPASGEGSYDLQCN